MTSTSDQDRVNNKNCETDKLNFARHWTPRNERQRSLEDGKKIR